MVADVSKEDKCAAFVQQVLKEHGEIDHAVSCFGAWWQGGESAGVVWEGAGREAWRRKAAAAAGSPG